MRSGGDRLVDGYGEATTLDAPIPAFDVAALVDEVGAVSTPGGLRVLIGATGTKGERVGVLLDADDVAAVAEVWRRIGSGTLLDA